MTPSPREASTGFRAGYAVPRVGVRPQKPPCPRMGLVTKENAGKVEKPRASFPFQQHSIPVPLECARAGAEY